MPREHRVHHQVDPCLALALVAHAEAEVDHPRAVVGGISKQITDNVSAAAFANVLNAVADKKRETESAA